MAFTKMTAPMPRVRRVAATGTTGAGNTVDAANGGFEPASRAPTRAAPAGADATRGLKILSSAHLADAPAAELSELEFGLIVAGNAFTRWTTRCMAAAGMPDLGPTDILVLHHVQHRDRAKKLADICFTLNYEDAHVVGYALRKLVTLGLLAGEKQGKEVFYSVTAEGRALVARYREVRRLCLLPAVAGDMGDARLTGEAARLLRTLSGLYDQAARAAASL